MNIQKSAYRIGLFLVGVFIWRLSIACEPDSVTDIARFRGGVVRRVADVEGTLDERLGHYVEQSIWQDLLTAIAQERYQVSASVAADTAAETDWDTLMESAGLGAFADIPIVDILPSRLAE
ncbi:MAG: DUF928 domain-containing protein [Cyanobacteria bacterium P01_A01_bin.114]